MYSKPCHVCKIKSKFSPYLCYSNNRLLAYIALGWKVQTQLGSELQISAGEPVI